MRVEFYKTREQIREHFIQRLHERYEIKITDEEYELFCTNRYIKDHYAGILKRNERKAFGVLRIRGTDVMVVKNHERQLYVTALPSETMDTPEGWITVCFKKQHQFHARVVLRRMRMDMEAVPPAGLDRKGIALWSFEALMFPRIFLKAYFSERPMDQRRFISAIYDVMKDKYTGVSFDGRNMKKTLTEQIKYK